MQASDGMKYLTFLQLCSRDFPHVSCCSFFPTFITIGDNSAMGINIVDPKVVLGREVFPTGRAEELIHVE